MKKTSFLSSVSLRIGAGFRRWLPLPVRRCGGDGCARVALPALSAVVFSAGLLFVPQAMAQTPPPRPQPEPPAEQTAPAVLPGKAKGAWTGEYPIPKPPLPEGPVTAPPPAPEAPQEVEPEPAEKSPAQSATRSPG